MLDSPIPWQRFWVPRGALLQSFLGPLEWTAEFLQSVGGMSLEELRTQHAVVLLGEPGMGKTVTLRQDESALKQHCTESGAEPLLLNLASYSSEARLERDLFDNDKVTRWRQGSHALHVILDSFDECRLRIDTVGALLRDRLQDLPCDRLFLRVACRPALWPGTLEDALRARWPDSFLVAELAPLTREDLRAAARAQGSDPDAFLAEVSRLRASALAVRPVTLKMLLGAFRRGALPANRWQLYLDGCTELVQENNRDREESLRLQSRLGPTERLAVASRVAALTVLSNRDPIRIDSASSEASFDITLDELTGGEEEVRDGQPVPITREALREVLDSGLFRAVEGPRHLTWAHRTYEEFLGALFLHQRRMAPAQLRQLLLNPEDSRPGIIPQLQGLAAWLISKDSTFRAFLLELDPWMLLTSDALSMDEGLRAPLVEALLESARRDPATLSPQEARTQFRKLKHPELGSRLRPSLQTPGEEVAVRGTALLIALACEERSLLPECLALALETSAPVRLRAQALDVLRELGGAAPDERLLPLARLDAAEDPQGELRDRILPWLWPEVLPTEQLFEALRAPGDHAKLEHTQAAIRERLRPQDFPFALRWMQEYLSQTTPYLHLMGLTDAVLRQVFEHLDTPGLLAPYCAALWPKVKRACRADPALQVSYTEPWELPWDWSQRSDDERWRVLEGLTACRKSPEELRLLAGVKPPLLFPRDFALLLQRAEQASSPDEQGHWAHLISCCYPWGSPEPLEAIFQAIARDARLESAFAWLLKPISLEERPPLMRVVHMNMSSLLDVGWERVHRTPERVQQQCEQHLQRIESGQLLEWFPLVEVLPDTRGGEPNLLTSWRWRQLPAETQTRFIQAARSVVRDLRPQSEPWLEGQRVPWQASLYEAFNLLAAQGPEVLDTLPEAVWRHWATLILASPASSSDQGQRFRRALVERATRHAPVEVMRAFRQLMALAAEEAFKFSGRASTFIHSLAGCWNETLHQMALEVLRNPATPLSINDLLFETLLPQQVPEVESFAESMRHEPGELASQRRIQAARVLLTHGPVARVPALWSWLQQDVDFARKVLDRAAFHSYAFAERCEPGLLADIYLWIEHHGREPQAPGWSHPWWETFQRSILEQLPKKMTRSAETALERLCRELPGDEKLREKLFDTRRLVRARTWTPPSPREILELVGRERRRLVRTGQELLSVVLESLQRLEQKLHAETPAIRFLWNEDDTGKRSPKDELHLSDWVKLHLEQDLEGKRIVVNREVEVRPALPSRRGERVDLWVDAIAGQQGAEDRISLLIEVKLAYHRELWTAMKHQLVERYLSDNQLRYGIYLVGWYACADWDRTTSHPEEGRVSLERARQLLDAQARALSQGDVQVRAFVLDASFRPEPHPRKRTSG